MERMWHDAPAAALHVWDDADGLHALPNAAAAAWGAAHGVVDGDWQALAAGATSGGTARLGRHAVGLRRVALNGGGALLWLRLPEAAERASAFLDRALSLAGAVVWRYDLRTRRVHFNAVGFEALGLQQDPAGVALEHLVAGTHPEDRAAVQRADRAAWTHGGIVDVVARFRRPGTDGDWRPLLTRRVRDHAAGGAPTGLAGVMLDLTSELAERTRDDERAQARHERARAAFAIEAADVGVWERALDGSFVYWNDAMYRLRGLQPGDPRPIAELPHGCIGDGADGPGLEQLVARHMASGEPMRHECRVRRPDGSERWLLMHGRAMRDGAGTLLGMAGIDIDVTERHAADALRAEVARAEAVRRDKSAFLARVSHELRTPMNAVLGFTHLIDDDRSEKPTPRQRARLQRIADAGRQMMALVDDLLELASLDAGASGAAPGPATTSLPHAMQQVLDTMAALAQTEGVGLTAAGVSTWGAVQADPRRLAQLLTLLVTHAVRAERRGGQVAIGCRREDDSARATVVVELQGSGDGYSDAEAETLFEPFLRHGAASTSGAGTGLGLALAQRLAHAMDGDIALDSGRVLQLRLPAAPSLPAGAAADGGGAPAAAASAPAAGTLRVLCVEDNPVNLLLVRELLALRPGVVLRTAVDGASGIAMALAEAPDVLLLDLQLPDISGTEVLLHLRDQASMAGCIYVALSADAMPEHIAQARATGFDDYWTKPIEFERFLAGIDRLAARFG